MEINYLAVLIAAIASMALGFIWYSPAGFGKQWMLLMGYDDAKIKAMKDQGNMNKIYASNFVGEIILAYVLAYFIGTAAATTATGGAMVAIWAWLGFIAVTQLGTVLWDQKPTKLFYINTGYRLVGLIIMGAIIGTF